MIANSTNYYNTAHTHTPTLTHCSSHGFLILFFCYLRLKTTPYSQQSMSTARNQRSWKVPSPLISGPVCYPQLRLSHLGLVIYLLPCPLFLATHTHTHTHTPLPRASSCQGELQGTAACLFSVTSHCRPTTCFHFPASSLSSFCDCLGSLQSVS